MPIKDTYSELILEQILRDLLLHGESPRLSTITSDFNTFAVSNDLSKPLFDSANSKVSFGEVSSASKNNSINNTIQQDLSVLYKFLFDTSEQALLNFERWKAEAQLLEGRVDILTDRVSNLLLLASDTAGYFNFVQDNFIDTSMVDLANTSAYVNVKKGIATIGTSSSGATRIDLSSLRNSNVEFTVLSRNNLVAVVSAEGSQPVYAISDSSSFWQERVYTSKSGPVSAELKIHFLQEETVSRIDLDLHMSNQSASVQITAMYSLDNYNWILVPTNNFTQSVSSKAVFRFSPVQANWIKLIMTKPGYDVMGNNLYGYEFGLDSISFYHEGFTANADSVLISKALSVLDTTGQPEEFGRVVLEVCEDIPDGTSIYYYLGVTDDENTPASGINFVGIDPITRASTSLPTVLDFGDLSEIVIEDIYPSYDPNAASAAMINPAADFDYLQSVAGGTILTASGISSAQRYSFANSNERILTLSLGPGIQVAQKTLELWRNVHTVGQDYEVRGTAHGWRYEDPYYWTTVLVNNANGSTIDWGGKTALVDGAALSGKITLNKGRHTIGIHKDNWKIVDSTGITTLEELRLADSLYPYNHRYIVEGFNYPTSWSTEIEKVYLGFDVMAEYMMQEVSILDLIGSVASDDYARFAIDYDTGDAGRTLDGSAAPTADQVPIRVFVVKVDESQSDFMNELFMLRFKSANTLYSYIRFKAVLSTEDTTITPVLDSYRIKVSA